MSRIAKWGALCAVVCVFLSLGACGGDPEEERIALLASDPGASLKENSGFFLAEIGNKGDWTVVGEAETSFRIATQEDVGLGELAEGAQLGLLKVVLADKEKKETAFRFVFVSVPIYGSWRLKKIGVLDANDQIQTFGGDDEAFWAINANQNRHPTHPDYVGP